MASNATCKKCLGVHDKEEENWVQCDKCDDWYHFQCVGVDASIANHPWVCGPCNKALQNSATNTGTASNGRQQTKAPGSIGKTNKTTKQTQNKVPPLNQNLSTGGKSKNTETSSEINHQIGATTQNPSSAQTATQNQQFTISPDGAHRKLMLALLEEEKEAYQKYLERKYAILAQTADPDDMFTFRNNESLSSTQIAARHSIPKDLPTFSGDPEEWPAFYCSFENSTKIAGLTDVENMLRLQKCLKGKAKDMVKDKLIVPSMVADVMATLKTFFGRPEHIIERMIERIRKTTPLKEKLEAIIEYALLVSNTCGTMEACHMEAHLNNPTLLKEMVDKLPNQHKLSWAMYQRDNPVPNIKNFSDWLYCIAEAAATVIPPLATKSIAVNTHIQSHGGSRCHICEATGHKTAQCEKLSAKSLDDRWNTVAEKKLCRQCLNLHKGRCFSRKECGVSGCKAKHHPMLHREQTIATAASGNTSAANSDFVSAHSETLKANLQYFRIIPVRLYNKTRIINVFAFLDEGSSVTLIEQEVFDQLGVRGRPDPICLQWTGDTTREENLSVCAPLQISSLDNNRKYWLHDVHTVQNLSLPEQTVDVDYLNRKYRHLDGIPLRSYSNSRPVLLIGANNWKLSIPRKIREGGWSDPIASKCLLGWAIQGASRNSGNSVLNIHACQCKWEELHEAIKETFSLDPVRPQARTSAEEARAIEIANRTCKKTNGQYEVGLLWRNDDIVPPESYQMALKRAKCLQHKIEGDTELRKKIQQQVDNLKEKGYAYKLNDSELNRGGLTWYLPIFITKNPNKPNRVRLVWDAAAKSHGVSLNDLLLTGPDLLRPLVEVLMAFRVGRVAVCGDIAEMFHRINLLPRDTHAQRFLWFDDEHASTPSIYVMRAMCFGIRCAPYLAHYVRDKNASDFQHSHPRAFEVITQSHYVDDFIDSMHTNEEAIQVASDVRSIHATGGFHIRNWTSNSPIVLKALYGESEACQAPVNLGGTERVLGMYWNPIQDKFQYICRFARLRRNVIAENVVPTKREALQILMSIFDPLGFLSAHTITLKIMLQQVWRTGINWDDELPECLRSDWKSWTSKLQAISSMEIPRCYSPDLGFADNIELHTFVDASEYAYAAVCYLRIQARGMTTTSLELQAAVIGVRLAETVSKTRRLQINARIWWSDSKTVLRWLHMDPRNFQQFVMHRVGEILDNTEIHQWRWVPSQLNVADMATKKSAKLNIETWLNGPKFLESDENNWPVCDELGKADHGGIRKHLLIIKQANTLPPINYKYFSNWKRLYRALATFILYVERLRASSKNRSNPTKVTFEHIKKAKNVLLQEAQRSAYADEIHALSRSKPIGRPSELIAVNVYLDKYGILRVQGRASHISATDAIVLPKTHAVTLLVVRHYHEEFRHQCHESTINRIRGKYYIPRLRVLYRTVRSSCQFCKNKAAKPIVPQTAPLPAARLASFERPFSYVGIDYFGPFLVTVGRHKEKRWGVVFTCLTLRAIHIEVAHSLDTSSCIMCIRNFISRRGTPIEIFSDNGTNFKATEKIIQNELCLVDFADIQAKYDSIKWHFNPPGAPHMGGAWERLIRSIKAVLFTICPSEKFSDESLRSDLCEVEFIINARPLTHLTLEHSDDQALTPNHLLLGSSDGFKIFNGESTDLRSRWRQTQLFADRFWKRWIREYGPTLTKRSQWFEKRSPIRIGDIVVVVDENLPRNCWPKGRVTGTVVAKDGQVRRATIVTQSGSIVRPTAKLAVLDVGIQIASSQSNYSLAGRRMLPP